MKIAVVHEWLVTYAGSERVVEQMLRLYNDADLYSLVDFLSDSDRHHFQNKRAKTSFIQKLPFARAKYRQYLPLMPSAIERLDLSNYDIILSSSHAVAKGVRKRKGQLHICYCHTPMRYAWDLQDQYLKESGLDRGVKGAIVKKILAHLRVWDFSTANRVDYFIANSHYIADRVKRAYNRDADVIYPPVDVERYSLSDRKEDFYLAASRMVPYKKMDLIVETFSSMPDKKLVVVGDGPDYEKVKARAGNNIQFLGYQSFEKLKDYMQRAKAFIFAAEEDFGIIAVEAQACGTPVIAYGRGGALETVIGLQDRNTGVDAADRPTGVFFNEQTVESLKNSVLFFEKNDDKFNGQHLRENAIRFSVDRFKREFKDFVDNKIAKNTT